MHLLLVRRTGMNKKDFVFDVSGLKGGYGHRTWWDYVLLLKRCLAHGQRYKMTPHMADRCVDSCFVEQHMVARDMDLSAKHRHMVYGFTWSTGTTLPDQQHMAGGRGFYARRVKILQCSPFRLVSCIICPKFCNEFLKSVEMYVSKMLFQNVGMFCVLKPVDCFTCLQPKAA